MQAPEQYFSAVFWAWIIAGVTCGIFFFFSPNAALKRRLWPPYVIGAAIMFFFLAWWIVPIEVLFAVAPWAAFIIFINLRLLKFCDVCGATTQNVPFRPARFCARCGAALPR